MLKILKSDGSTVTDISTALNDYASGTYALTYTSATDKIYIGCSYPFAHKYFKVSSGNASSATMSIKYWDGTQFRSAADVIDSTVTSGRSLATSGYIQWTPNKQYRWTRAGDTSTETGSGVTGLTSVKLYDLYWLEVTFSANMAATIDWVGDLFCTETDIQVEYPDLLRSNMLTAFSAGKTSWEEQRVRASELLINDLRAHLAIAAGEQVIKREQLKLATISRTAMLAFDGMGQGYADRFAAAEKQYKERSKAPVFETDQNEDGRLSPSEQGVRVSRLWR
jgi:hypothetical protein